MRARLKLSTKQPDETQPAGVPEPPEADETFTQSFDAQDWAKAFAKRFPILYQTCRLYRDDVEAVMIGWFANAIMRGWDEHARLHPEPSAVGRLPALPDEKLIDAVRALDPAAADGQPYGAWDEAKWRVFNAAVRFVKESNPVGRLPALQSLVDQQAEDEGLWFVAQTAAEAYLQQELRRLHAAIEGEGMMSCQLPFALPESTWRCQLPKGHYGPCAEFDYGAKLEWPNPDTPLPPETAGGRLTAESEDRDVLAERFARDPISKEATIEHLQALLADVTLQRDEFFARLEHVEQEAGQVLNDQAGRLPALEALLHAARLLALSLTPDMLESLRPEYGNTNVAVLTQWQAAVVEGLAGLRADPAPRQLLENKEDAARGDRP